MKKLIATLLIAGLFMTATIGCGDNKPASGSKPASGGSAPPAGEKKDK